MSHQLCYIASNNATRYLTTNVREKPTTNSRIISFITPIGNTVQLIDEEMDGAYIWSHYLFFSGVEGWIRNDVHDRAPMRERVYIDVPYVNQIDKNADEHINDCGIATSLSIIQYKIGDCSYYTVEDLANVVHLGRTNLTTFPDMYKCFEKFRVKYEYQRPFNLANGIRELNLGNPYVALINYSKIRANKKFPHFVVVIGYEDEHVYIHDPIDPSNKKLPLATFSNAIAYTDENGNLPFQAVLFPK